ncbi:MAG TPA: MBOAT family O-acyltransferase [Phycisphaerae bacterium]|nr:MBOAT family O-acyltransferase [Phycisphaerae bacterium]HNU46492.1 MBOAT family O-acyltransferase [Phycisphaerae bacterium]
MAFNSLHFLLFFPLVTTGAWLLRRHAGLRMLLLLFASYYFYMSWNWKYAGLLLGSTLLDYVVALGMARTASIFRRRLLFIASLSGNLGVLFVFKYYNFFADSVAQVAAGLGAPLAAAHHSLLLPVGISFYTFQTLSYTIDVYRGQLQPTRNFLKFALFVSFFPQLVAGPIVRAGHFLPQLDARPRFDDRAAELGLGRIFLGLFKKICLADLLGTALVDPVFANPGACSSWTLLLAMYGYAFQIYYDFSGYSDIALGAAKVLGFELPINFDRPYLATSLRDFWRRWHISLSTWLRDYLYMPLGGGRGSALRTARNLALVMLLGGLWHGAAWGFVLWGALHGLLLGAGRLFHHVTGIDADRNDQPLVSRLARVVVTFHLVAGCFVVFRAVEWPLIRAYFGTLLSFQPGLSVATPAAYWVLLVATLYEWVPRAWLREMRRGYLALPSPAQAGVLTTALLVFAAVGSGEAPFIYFQF